MHTQRESFEEYVEAVSVFCKVITDNYPAFKAETDNILSKLDDIKETLDDGR